MYCSQCGREVKTGARFCAGCGAAVGRAKAAEEVAHDVITEAAGSPKQASTKPIQEQELSQPTHLQVIEDIQPKAEIHEEKRARTYSRTLVFGVAAVVMASIGGYLYFTDFISKKHIAQETLSTESSAPSAESGASPEITGIQQQPGPIENTQKEYTTSSINAPPIQPGDTYVVESLYLDNQKLNNTTERKVVSVDNEKVIVASKNVKSGYTRTLEFTSEWNLLSSRDPKGGGSNYYPPLKYFEFPLYPGKTWQQTSVETNIKTNSTRQHTLSATVGDWEEITVPAGTFRAIKITTQTELLDRETGQKSTGVDVSWYMPDIRRSVKSSLTTRNFSGNQERQLIQLIKYDLNQSINKIAFTSNRNCLTGNNCSHVYLMDTDGSNLQILTTGTPHNYNPAISPDGKRVVFSTKTTYDDALFIISLADMKIEILKERLGSSGGTMGLSWSPDGKSLVYAGYVDNHIRNVIEIFNLESKKTTRLTTNLEDDSIPSFSFDGGKIAFISRHSSPSGLYMMDSDGTNRTFLFGDMRCLSPDFSPVDLTIALDCVNIKTKSYDLFIFDVVTKNITQLTSFPTHENHPSWSPDGKRIAFSSNMDDPNYRTCSAAIGDEHCNNEIYVIEVDGTNLTRLTFNDADDGSPSWAP